MTADLYRQIRDEERAKLGSGGWLRDAAASLDELDGKRPFPHFRRAAGRIQRVARCFRRGAGSGNRPTYAYDEPSDTYGKTLDRETG